MRGFPYRVEVVLRPVGASVERFALGYAVCHGIRWPWVPGIPWPLRAQLRRAGSLDPRVGLALLEVVGRGPRAWRAAWREAQRHMPEEAAALLRARLEQAARRRRLAGPAFVRERIAAGRLGDDPGSGPPASTDVELTLLVFALSRRHLFVPEAAPFVGRIRTRTVLELVRVGPEVLR